ncbi:DUF4230 domain-containing protein [Oscillatoria sp. FACHB-1407]|uniref:DUF4230 domain-containing protein n=1 Tax=Oscillatoria sp. FACHB-1407 TaxID=2692847 RepID=UPI001688A6E0|nr:DUF4230 domain-containing protein [Oscillatoria sp. FACHB-1407]MBD2462991.1 DUF4230 domain-containing protein [Oscillatoria sp. FACHB-1407]
MSNYKFGDRHDLEERLASLEQQLLQRRSGGGFFKKLSLMLTGGIALAGLFVGIGVWRAGDQFLNTLQSAFLPPQPEPQVDVESVVVEQVRGVSELTTAVFAMQAVVPTSRDRTFGGYVVGKTTLLYVAYGEVRAGVDLSKVQSGDIDITENSVYLRLPPPEILDSKIDVTRSRVYDYDRGFLGLGPDAAPELQDLAQRETLNEIVAAACTEGVLQEASDRAKLVVTQLLNTAGYRDITIETQPPAADACPTTPQ